jgi:ceramide synthetase
VVLVLVLLFCIEGFLRFREYCVAKGYYVFSTDSLIWCAVGFAGIFVVKYSYYHFMKGVVERVLHSKYEGEERIYKVNSVLKLSLDSVFYSFTTVLAYILFRDEYWFPSIVGGCGECAQIYRDYPNWPTNTANLEMYFMIQLGVHIFSVFEMIVIKRKTERKFYELLLHHFVAATLILFSMMCNEITAGSMILIVHDMSDIMMAFGRAYCETKYETKKKTASIYVGMTLVWIYLRILVFPFCLLANVYANKPTPQDEWHIISFEYGYLLLMAFVLYGMHLFWTYFLIKLGVRSAQGKTLRNVHDDPTKEK